jgi:hypothetical protein
MSEARGSTLCQASSLSTHPPTPAYLPHEDVQRRVPVGVGTD